MKATAERVEKNTVVMEVEVDAERFEKAIDQAYRKLVKQVNVPGFRRGKAPRRVIENYLGKAALYNEAVEIMVPDAYVEALEQTGVEPISQPQLELVQLREGEPVKFKATVKVKPEVELGQYAGLEVNEVSAEVTEGQVDKELEALRHRYAQLVTVEEGGAQKGDVVNIDFTGRIDGEEFEGGKGTDYSLELGSGTFIPGFEEQLEGMNPGETREVKVTFPEDYHNQELAGKEAEFTVTVKSIKRKELAPLDDEFAKDVSEFDTLEELRADVLNNLKRAAEENSKQQMRSEVVSKAVQNAEVELPEEMVENRLEEMVKDMERRLMMQGLSMEDYLKHTGSTLDELKENLRPEAERTEKTALVLDAIGKKEGIDVTEEEIDNRINEMAGQYQQDPKTLRKILEGQGQLELLKDGIRREKTIDFLMENAKIVQKAEENTEENTEE